jgi:hypothetical protein
MEKGYLLVESMRMTERAMFIVKCLTVVNR